MITYTRCDDTRTHSIEGRQFQLQSYKTRIFGDTTTDPFTNKVKTKSVRHGSCHGDIVTIMFIKNYFGGSYLRVDR